MNTFHLLLSYYTTPRSIMMLIPFLGFTCLFFNLGTSASIPEMVQDAFDVEDTNLNKEEKFSFRTNENIDAVDEFPVALNGDNDEEGKTAHHQLEHILGKRQIDPDLYDPGFYRQQKQASPYYRRSPKEKNMRYRDLGEILIGVANAGAQVLAGIGSTVKELAGDGPKPPPGPVYVPVPGHGVGPPYGGGWHGPLGRKRSRGGPLKLDPDFIDDILDAIAGREKGKNDADVIDDILDAIARHGKEKNEHGDIPEDEDIPELEDAQEDEDIPELEDAQEDEDIPELEDAQEHGDVPELEDAQDHGDIPEHEDLPGQIGIPEEANVAEKRDITEHEDLPGQIGIPEQRDITEEDDFPEEESLPEQQDLPGQIGIPGKSYRTVPEYESDRSNDVIRVLSI